MKLNPSFLRKHPWILGLVMFLSALPAWSASGPLSSPGRGYCLAVPEGQLLDLFSPRGLTFPVASAVRGGVFADRIPEMSMAAFEKIVESAPAIIEVRPHVSTDGTLFLLPDETLDRTTTGAGLAITKSWAELQQLKLVDNAGRVTEERIPTLREALVWAKGKTILQINLFNEVIGLNPDLTARVVQLVRELAAHDRVMMISWSNSQAQSIHQLDPRLPIAVFSLGREGLLQVEALGVPARNIVPTMSFDTDPVYLRFLRQRGQAPAYITYFFESSDLQSRQATETYRRLWNEGVVIQATTRVEDFGRSFNYSAVQSPFLTRGCLPAPSTPMCMGEYATIVGTEGMDVIVGTQQRDVIVALGGDDIITGGDGDDLICAGDGNDIVDAGRGRDRIEGGSGDDILYGGDDDDVIDGGSGTDTVDGGEGRDECLATERPKRCDRLR